LNRIAFITEAMNGVTMNGVTMNGGTMNGGHVWFFFGSSQ